LSLLEECNSQTWITKLRIQNKEDDESRQRKAICNNAATIVTTDAPCTGK
jgi:hypothetical protein